MYLRHKASSDLVEVMDVGDLIDPCHDKVMGRMHAGEEMQDAEVYDKTHLLFPSGEALPECWLNPGYRVH